MCSSHSDNTCINPCMWICNSGFSRLALSSTCSLSLQLSPFHCLHMIDCLFQVHQVSSMESTSTPHSLQEIMLLKHQFRQPTLIQVWLNFKIVFTIMEAAWWNMISVSSHSRFWRQERPPDGNSCIRGGIYQSRSAQVRGKHSQGWKVHHIWPTVDVNLKFLLVWPQDWTELLPMSKMQAGYKPSCHNYFEVSNKQRFTHVRLNMFPGTFQVVVDLSRRVSLILDSDPETPYMWNVPQMEELRDFECSAEFCQIGPNTQMRCCIEIILPSTLKLGWLVILLCGHPHAPNRPWIWQPCWMGVSALGTAMLTTDIQEIWLVQAGHRSWRMDGKLQDEYLWCYLYLGRIN